MFVVLMRFEHVLFLVVVGVTLSLTFFQRERGGVIFLQVVEAYTLSS